MGCVEEAKEKRKKEGNTRQSGPSYLPLFGLDLCKTRKFSVYEATISIIKSIVAIHSLRLKRVERVKNILRKNVGIRETQ